ncbi:SGNH/GDSL hydrolase family protein [Desulfosporosinus sp. FKA]|uniref:SGNH/GDSL hydrolase family protein n=1 Tax=Desulfosporosinus sp. FKA TaxID=1969834 RepID=UPI000B4A1745|nr:SGNH/GDSL hydrolase family protein [Desulfosporosinus sp. FKA]
MLVKNKIAIILSLAMVFAAVSFTLPQKALGAQSTVITGIKKLKTNNINAVILGDSISVSQGASDPLTNGWNSDLNNSLSKLYGHRIIWDNKGSSGTLVDYCLQRAVEINKDTDAVFICVGRNDRNFYQPGQFSLKYTRLIRLIQKEAPQADIFCIVEPPMVSTDESLFKGIRSQIIIACNNTGADLLDVWNGFPENQTNLSGILSDGLHPLDIGYNLMASYISDQLVHIINKDN